MRSVVGFWAAGLFGLLAAAPLPAEPVSPLELVRGLREQGMPDLALDYLNEVKGKLSKDDQALVPLETAKVKAAQAEVEADEGRRNARLNEAEKLFKDFIAQAKGHPLAPQARFELARLVAARARETALRGARRGGPAAKDATVKARGGFSDAAKQLGEAAQAIDEKLKAADGDKGVKAQLTASKFQALLEQGINLVEVGKTYSVDSGEVRDRAKFLTDAQAALNKLAKAPDTPEPTRWLAKAWSAQVDELNQKDKDAIKKAYDAVLTDRSPESDAARRLVGYFRARQTFLDQTNANRYLDAARLCREWLSRYAGFADTADGQNVRFVLARSLEVLAENGIVRDKETKRVTGLNGDARLLLTEAAALYKKIADAEGERAEQAGTNRLRCILAVSQADKKGDVTKLTTFQECYLNAQVELGEYAQWVKQEQPTGDVLEAEKKNRFAKIVDYLERAQLLARPSDPPRDVYEARCLLAYSYLTAGLAHQAAVLGEHIARTFPKENRSLNAALYGLQGYAGVIRPDGGEPLDKPALEKAKLKALAEYVEKTWPAEPATDFARHQLGIMLRLDKDYPASFEVLTRVSPAYPALAQARLDLAAAALEVGRSRLAAGKGRDEVVRKAIADVEALPVPTPADPADQAQAAVLAKLQLGPLLRMTGDEKRYEKIEELGKSLKEAVGKLAQLGDKQAELRGSAEALQLSGLTGRAFVESQADHHAKAVELLQPAVNAIKEAKDPSGGIPPGLVAARRELVQQALLSSVQDGKIEQANALFDLTEKLAAGEEAQGALVKVVQEVQKQLRDLGQRKKDKERAALAKGFTAFLDERSKRPGLKPDVQLFLAGGYMGIDQPEGAIKLLKKIPPPAGGADKEAERVGRGAQVTLLRAYRDHGRDLLEAKKPGSDEAFKEAEKVLKDIMGTSEKPGWGGKSLEMMKERVFLAEAQGKYAPAYQEWMKLYKGIKVPPKPKDGAADTEVKQYEALKAAQAEMYFYAFRVLVNSAAKADPAKRAELFGKRADDLVKFEAANPDGVDGDNGERFVDLLNDHPELKKEYVKQGGKLVK